MIDDQRAKLNETQRGALKWFIDRGGDAGAAKTKAGGRQYLCQGEVAPFQPITIKGLVETGYAERYQIGSLHRVRFFSKPRAATKTEGQQ